MLGLILEAMILIGLIKIFTDDDVGFWKPVGIALLTAIATAVLAGVFFEMLGLWGIVVGVTLAAALLAGLLTLLFGIEFKNSSIIGVAFVFIHVGIQVLFYFMFHV